MAIISGYGKLSGLTHILAFLFLASRLTSVVIVLYGLSKTHSAFFFGHLSTLKCFLTRDVTLALSTNSLKSKF